MPIIISTRKYASSGLYIVNHLMLAKTFKYIFSFLNKSYFSYITFKLVYLTRKKTFIFDNKLNILGFCNVINM